jgi:16S rRNA (guanine966-N2)-methyltransferase
VRIIAGEARGRRLLEPADRSIRPPLDRIRESIFSILLGVFEDHSVLDLFAGTGSFGLEALSRGARRATFVESSKAGAALLRKNIRSLGFETRSEVIQGDALRVPDLSGADRAGMALVFLDPPFKIFREERTPGGVRSDAPKVFDRVNEALSSPSVSPGGIVVLRIPSSWRGEPPVPPLERRDYGESAVLLYERA